MTLWWNCVFCIWMLRSALPRRRTPRSKPRSLPTRFLMTTDAMASLAGLPLPVLDPSQRLLGVLCDWGIHRVGELRSLDRQDVAERLGTEGLELWEQAAGGSPRPLRLIRAEASYEEVAEFEGGIETLEPILFRLRRALEQIARRLRADYLLAGGVELILHLDDRTALARTIQIPAPTCDVDTLFRILGTYLDTITTDSPIVAFRLQRNSLHPAQLTKRTCGKAACATPMASPKHWQNWRASSAKGAWARHCACLAIDLTAAGWTRRTLRPGDHAPRMRGVGFPPVGLSLRRYRPPYPRVCAGKRKERSSGSGCAAGTWRRGCARVPAPGGWMATGGKKKKAWRWEEWDVELDAGGLYRLANHHEKNWWMLGLYD